jgi:hypothetical protein
LCATVFYRKVINGRLYPKAARTGSYVYAQEVKRAKGKVVTKYLGIIKVPDRCDAIEKGGEDNADQPR